MSDANILDRKDHPNILAAFSRALGREAHVLSQHPDLLWQQLFNRLQWDWDTVKHVLMPALTRRVLVEPKPWIRLKTPYRESQALLRTLEGHTRQVTACDFSLDRHFILSGSFDHTLRLWDPITGRLLQVIPTPSMILDCNFSPDGSWILSVNDDTLRIWDTNTGEPRHQFQCYKGSTKSCSISPDGAFVLSSDGYSGKRVRLRHIATGRFYDFVGHTERVNACAFSPDGRLILSGSSDKTLQVWDASPGEMLPSLSDHLNRTWVESTFAWENHVLTLAGHTRAVTACAFSPDGQTILSGGWDNTLRLWHATTGEALLTLEGHNGPVAACAFSPDGRWLVSGSYDTTLRLWDAHTGEILGIFGGHTEPIRGCRFSSDGALLVSASEDNTLRIWDMSLYGEGKEPNDHTADVRSCTYSQDGRLVVSASKDETIRTWAGASGQVLHTLKGHQGAVNQCGISPGGGLMVSSGVDGTVRIWSTETGELIDTLDCHVDFMRPGDPTISAVSPNGRQVGSATQNAVKIWDSRSGQCLHLLKGHTDEVYGLEFSPDGHFLASASRDRTVRVWDTSSGERVHTLEGGAFMRACSFSPDGRWIISAGGDIDSGHLGVWDTTTGQMLRNLAGHTQQVRLCSISPDGCHLVSYALDGTLRIWDLAEGTCLHTLDHLPAFMNACVFSPDGRLLVSAVGKTLYTWDIGSYEVQARMPLPGNLSALSLHPFKPEFVVGDSGGALYWSALVGIQYGPVLITAVDRGDRLGIRCPACQGEHPVAREQLGSVFTCPTPGCSLQLKLNPFVLEQNARLG